MCALLFPLNLHPNDPPWGITFRKETELGLDRYTDSVIHQEDIGLLLIGVLCVIGYSLISVLISTTWFSMLRSSHVA